MKTKPVTARVDTLVYVWILCQIQNTVPLHPLQPWQAQCTCKDSEYFWQCVCRSEKIWRLFKIKLSSDTGGGGGWRRRIPGNIFLKSNFSKIRYKIAIKIKLVFKELQFFLDSTIMQGILLCYRTCSSTRSSYSYNFYFKFVILIINYKRDVHCSIQYFRIRAFYQRPLPHCQSNSNIFAKSKT